MATPTSKVDPKVLTAVAALVVDAINSGDKDGGWSMIKDRARETFARDPIDVTLVTVFASAYLFWRAERKANPKVKTFGDAMVFTTTCISVGYSDIFARTAYGKAIASWLMTVGPSMAAAFFNPPAAKVERDTNEQRDVQKQILAKLDAILVALERQNASAMVK
jgi:voltage-gated potassium channel